jgi:exopolysaccharide biosynthesis polyprenyl glycosylphosphotransferase
MQQNFQIDPGATTGIESAQIPFLVKSPAPPSVQLRPAVARALAGPFCATVDLAFLSVILIFLALWASGENIAGNLVGVLSLRLTIGHFVEIALCWVIWRTIFSYCGLYTWQHLRSATGVPGRVALASGISALFAAEIVGRLWHHGHSVRVGIAFWIAATAGALLSRVAICLFHMYIRPHFRRRRNAVIVGGGARAARFLEELRFHPEWNYTFLGCVDNVAGGLPDQQGPLLGSISDLEEILMKHVVDEVVIALPVGTQYAAIERTISICKQVGVQVQYGVDFFDPPRSGHCIREAHDHRKMIVKMVQDDYRHRIKRTIDVIGALTGLILFAPLFAVVAIAIKSTSKGPVLFKQKRYGLGKRTFHIYKFRTMVANAEAAQASLEHMNENAGPVFKIFKDPRITKVGAFLRRTSIDELPQLLNVLKGEMSLVGPRPLNLRDVGRFSEAWLMRRFSVKPGLTCLWQISGRSTVSFDKWIQLDLHYIDHWSLELDMRILARTIPAVVRGTGAA